MRVASRCCSHAAACSRERVRSLRSTTVPARSLYALADRPKGQSVGFFFSKNFFSAAQKNYFFIYFLVPLWVPLFGGGGGGGSACAILNALMRLVAMHCFAT